MIDRSVEFICALSRIRVDDRLNLGMRACTRLNVYTITDV